MSAVAESSVLAQYVDHVSPSSLSRFVRCPESYRQRYLLKKREPAGWKALLGSADSKAYELYLLARMSGVRMPMADVEDAFRDHVRGADDEYLWDDKDGKTQTPDGVVDLGIPTVRAYFPVAESMPDPIAVEEGFRYTHPSLPIPIVGYIDYEVPETIVERKNAARAGASPGWRNQRRIYSAVKSKPVALHVTTRTKVPAVYTPLDGDQYLEPWSSARAEKTIQRVGAVIGQIETLLISRGPDRSWPTHGYEHDWACSHCAYKKDCLAWA